MRGCPRCQHRYSDSEAFCSRDGAPLSAPDGRSTDPLLGERVGAYVIEDRLSEGGMGIVYRAKDERGKKVALKVLKSEYAQNPDILDRFRREALAVNQIRHKNIVEILELGELERGSPFILMEYLEGRDLGALLAESAPLPPGRSLEIALEVAEALAAAHEAGVVHRDLKPENIFLCSAGPIKLLDFGLAKLEKAPEREPEVREAARTRSGVIMGTPAYMAPEQASGKPVSPKTDVYALGVILYEMLTGRVPFRSAEGPLHVMMQHLSEQPTPPRELRPELPAALERVVLGCLEKSQERRYPSMRALKADLARVREGKEAELAPPPLPAPSRGGLRALAFLGFLVVLAALGAASLYALAPSEREPELGAEAGESLPPPPKEEPRTAPSPLPPAPASAPALPETVTVRLSTEPAGALIVMDGNPQKQITPATLVLPRQEREVRFSFRLEGYEERDFPLSLVESGALEVKLGRLHEAHKKPSAKETPGAATQGPASRPTQGPPPDQLDPYEK